MLLCQGTLNQLSPIALLQSSPEVRGKTNMSLRRSVSGSLGNEKVRSKKHKNGTDTFHASV